MPKEKFTINRKDFTGIEFNSMMVSGGGRRLWVSYKDGGHSFKIESLKTGEIVFETWSLGAAVGKFNEL